jgi:hypothetical protein
MPQARGSGSGHSSWRLMAVAAASAGATARSLARDGAAATPARGAGGANHDPREELQDA